MDFDRPVDFVAEGKSFADHKRLSHRVAEKFFGEQTNVGFEKTTLQQVNPTRAHALDVFQADLADVGEHFAPMTIEVRTARTHLDVPAMRRSGTVKVHNRKARCC
jgi:hypothetical protein